MKALITPNQLGIIKEITSRIAVSRIYQIGHRHGAQTYDGIYRRTKSTREHFDLLVVVDGICDQKTFRLQEVINSHSATGVSVSLWVHSAASIEESMYDLKYGHFFHLVLSAGKLIYQMPDDDDFDNVLDPGELSIQAGHHQIWARGYHRANVLLVVASNTGENDAGAIKLWLLHQAMKQLCLAFIFKMIGYRPNQRSLGHLLGICRCITQW